MDNSELVRLKNIVINCENGVSRSDLLFFAINFTKMQLEKRGITANINIRDLDKGFAARCVISNAVNMQNGEIIGKQKPNYTINLDRKFLDEGILSMSGDKAMPQLLDVMHVISHEVYHAVQNENYDKSKITNNSLITAKEDICREYNGFYDQNYLALLTENEAEIEGWESTKQALLKFAPEMLSKYGNQINNTVDEIKKRQDMGMITINSGGVTETLKNVFVATIGATKKIASNPQKYLTIYPNLNIEYNKNGTKKTYQQLMSDMNQKLSLINGQVNNQTQMQEIISLYDGIILSDRDLVKQKNQTIVQKPQNQNNQYPPNDLRREGERLNLTEGQVLEEERRKRRENFSAYVDLKMQADILNSLFNESKQSESFVEDIDQIENRRVR